jgi:hypothetical protein
MSDDGRGGASSMADRLWLEVPYDEKDAAKAAGARWDPVHRCWYAAHVTDELRRWAARPPLPELLPGEDRSFGGDSLFVDLVPDSCWFTNVRSCLDKRDWDRLRRMIYRRAGDRCEICGAGRDSAAQVWLEAHERWSYEPDTRTQHLVRLICLCTPCHRATHFGLAEIQGHGASALDQLVAVNRWSPAQARRHVDEAFNLWRQRCAIDWHLDLSMLSDAGLAPTAPPQATERRAAAMDTLSRTRISAPAPAQPASPPGWYRDPAGMFTHRWWTGSQWTRWVVMGGHLTTDTVT